jgi:hypothetical protein
MSQQINSKRLCSKKLATNIKQHGKEVIFKRQSNARVESQIELFEAQLRETQSIVTKVKIRLRELNNKSDQDVHVFD